MFAPASNAQVGIKLDYFELKSSAEVENHSAHPVLKTTTKC